MTPANDNRPQPHLFEFLSRLEFKLCWAFAFIESQGREDYGGALGLDRYATPGQEGQTDSWLEEVKRAIRWLAFEHGYEFGAVTPYENGSIVCSAVLGSDGKPTVPEPANRLYVMMLAQGQLPSPLDAVRYAITCATEGPLKSLPVDLLRSVEADIQESLDSMPAMPPEITAKLHELDALALRALREPDPDAS